MEKSELKKALVISLLAVIVCFIVKNFWFFGMLIGIAVKSVYPLVLGVMIAYIFNIILGFFERHYFPKKDSGFIKATRRPVCLVFSFLCAVGIIVLVLTIVIPELINALKLITMRIPPLLTKVMDWIIAKLAEYPEIQKQANEIFNEFDFKTLDWTSITGKVADFVQNGFVGILSSAVGIIGAIASTTTNIIIAVIFAIYLLLRKDKLLTDINRLERAYLSEKLNKSINRVCKIANDTFQNFFVGQFIEAILLGCLCFIGMTIIQLPYAAMSAVLVGVTALIPIVGAFLGAGISAFIIFTESPTKALIFLIFLVVLQQLDNNIIYPKVVGDSVGLPGMWVLAAVTIGGSLGGVVGMIVGVPAAATVYTLVFEDLETREKKMGIESPVEKKPEPAEKKMFTFGKKKDAPQPKQKKTPQSRNTKKK